MTTRRQFLIATAGVSAAQAGITPALAADENEWPLVDEDVVLGEGWVKKCNPVLACFNDDNGRCWAVTGNCGTCVTHGFVGYTLDNFRCAYEKRDAAGNLIEKLCISTSSECATKCRVCG